METHRSLQVERLWHRCISIEEEELGRDHPRLAQTREELQRARSARLSVRDPYGVRSVPGIFGSSWAVPEVDAEGLDAAQWREIIRRQPGAGGALRMEPGFPVPFYFGVT